MRTEKGITLIALIITIIVMLILAGVALTALDENGLFNSAVNATEAYNAAAANEDQQLTNYQQTLNNYSALYGN